MSTGGTSGWSIAGAIAASIGTLYLLLSPCINKYRYKHAFSEIDYRLDDNNKARKSKVANLPIGLHSIYIQLKPRLKLTLSEVNLRFLLNNSNTDKAIVSELKDDNLQSRFDYRSDVDTVGGSRGVYGPHRTMAKNDLLKYKAKLNIIGDWKGDMKLSLRITTEEYGRLPPVRFKCVIQKQ